VCRGSGIGVHTPICFFLIKHYYQNFIFTSPIRLILWPLWQGSGFSKNGFGSDSRGEATSLDEPKPF
jgi:hypothetical protein